MAARKKGEIEEAAGSPPSKSRSCFVIMPISDPEGYIPGHFWRVFEDIFVPACAKAGYEAVRADQSKAANLIQLEILQQLISADIVLCDLSSRNPNVLFELGLRQAFDRPVVLVQEVGTQPIFDIALLRYAEYRRARLYHEVIEDQLRIANAITETVKAYEEGEGVNSLVKILSLTKPATLVEVQESDADPALQIVRAELSELRLEILRATHGMRDSGTSSSLPRPRSGLQSEILALLSGSGDKWMSVSQVAASVGADVEAVGNALKALFGRSILGRVFKGEEIYYGLITTTPQNLREGEG